MALVPIALHFTASRLKNSALLPYAKAIGMNKLIKRFLRLSAEGKSIVILAFLTIVPFLAMLPLFFFHAGDGYPLGAYALGWLLGSATGLLAYASMTFGARAILRKGDIPSGSLLMAVGFNFVRILLYAAVLIVSGICTFQSEWFGGFNAFNFWTAFGGLIPLTVVSVLSNFIEVKVEKEDSGAPSPKKE